MRASTNLRFELAPARYLDLVEELLAGVIAQDLLHVRLADDVEHIERRAEGLCQGGRALQGVGGRLGAIEGAEDLLQIDRGIRGHEEDRRRRSPQHPLCHVTETLGIRLGRGARREDHEVGIDLLHGIEDDVVRSPLLEERVAHGSARLLEVRPGLGEPVLREPEHLVLRHERVGDLIDGVNDDDAGPGPLRYARGEPGGMGCLLREVRGAEYRFDFLHGPRV